MKSNLYYVINYDIFIVSKLNSESKLGININDQFTNMYTN